MLKGSGPLGRRGGGRGRGREGEVERAEAPAARGEKIEELEEI